MLRKKDIKGKWKKKHATKNSRPNTIPMKTSRKRKALLSKGLPNKVTVEQYTFQKKINEHIDDKNKYLNKVCQKLEAYQYKTDLCMKIRPVTRIFTPNHSSIRSEDETLLDNTNQILQRWKSYWQYNTGDSKCTTPRTL